MIMLGDCFDQMKTLETNSVDSIITDPPYGLSFMGKKWDYDVPSVETWKEALRVLKPGGHLLSFGGTRTYHRMVVNIEDAGFQIRDQIQWIYGSGFPKSHNIKEGEFKGWGSALKPANEPICLARKPLDGTVARNIEKWGVGGLNIDESRIGFQNKKDFDKVNSIDSGNPKGRWPANVIFDEEAAAVLDKQSGVREGGHNPLKGNKGIFCQADNYHGNNFRDKPGGASRFFYVAKASKRERNAGLEGLEGLEVHRYGAGIGQGKTPEAPTIDKNHHPTVKPIKLMEYLIKLITPPNGIVLDPFMGSGSTGVAAKNLGFEFIGIEMSPEYFEIAEKRTSKK